MNIVVLGAGALGSILVAYLARAGNDVSLLARGTRAELLAREGVTVTGIAEFTTPVRIVTNPQELQRTDLLINTVKTYDTETALLPLQHLEVGSAISVQNGVLKNQQLADVFGKDVPLGTVADFSGEVLPDGRALFTRNVGIYIGELPAGISARVEAIVDCLVHAGIRSEASARIETLEWSKYVAWMGLTAIAVLTRLPTHQLLQDEDLVRLQVTLARESVSLADALQIEIDDLGGNLQPHSLSRLSFEEAVELVRSNGVAMEAAGITGHKMSALQDAERGRRLEVEETLGYAVHTARAQGLELPALETCYRLLSGINNTVGLRS